MRSLKRLLAVYIALALLFTSFPDLAGEFSMKAYAASTLNINISINNDSVTINWPEVDGATAYEILYRDPTGALKYYEDGSGKSIIPNDPVENYVQRTITGLSKDFIYKFKIKAGNDTDSDDKLEKDADEDGDEDDNEIIDEKSSKVLLGVTLDAEYLNDEGSSLPGGGKEIGANPGLRFRIKVPKQYSLADIETGGGTSVSFSSNQVDYDISLGTDNTGYNLTKLNVRYSSIASQYIVTRSETNTLKSVSGEVYSSAAEIYFDCWGVAKPEQATEVYVNNSYPTTQYTGYNAGTGFNAYYAGTNDFTNRTYNLSQIYKNPDITPGTVFRMSIMPRFFGDTVTSMENSVTGGYAFTPVRFQIAKSRSNDLLVTIFKVNQSAKQEADRRSFTYDILYSTSDQVIKNDFAIINALRTQSTYPPQGIVLGASQSDEFSQGSDRMTLFVESKDENTEFYYRVVAKAPIANQWLLSKTLAFKISDEAAAAPLPEDVRVISTESKVIETRNLFFGDYAADNQIYNVRTGEVKLIWKNPKINDDRLYYHIFLSPAQTDPITTQLETISNLLNDPSVAGTPKASKYAIRYREVLKVNTLACKPCDINGVVSPTGVGEYLTYTIKMGPSGNQDYSLFKVIDKDGNIAGNLDNTMYTGDENRYPTYLLPNKVYYVKIRSQKDTNPVSSPSDYSIPTAFTVVVNEKKNPPAPMNFSNTANEIEKLNDGTVKNTITMQWSKVNINLPDYSTTGASYVQYYDLYMSDSLDGEYVKIGSTQKGESAKIGNIDCQGQNVSNSDFITARISQFQDLPGFPNVVSRFGTALKPNFTYYFKVITRIDINNEDEDRVSEDSNIVPVTTKKGDVVTPGDSESGPKVPTGFMVAPDSTSNSNAVKLMWNEMEKSSGNTVIRYSLIRTARKLDSNQDDLSVIQTVHTNNNGYYQLDTPLIGSEVTAPAQFSYENGKFYLNVPGLQPNTIYYFSLRAEKVVTETKNNVTTTTTLSSIWVTLPVTTTLIEAPESLQVVLANEVAINWDANTAFDPSNFTFSIAEGGGSYKPVSNGEVTKSEEIMGSQSRFYARITGLKSNTTYNVQVTGSVLASGSTLTYNNTFTGLTTRDPKHAIDVKWKGRDGYDFEIAIKGEDETGSVQPGSTSTTVKLSNMANASSGFYNNLAVEIISGKGAGQQRTITSYNGTTRVASIDKAWDVIPDNTSQYKIYTEYQVLARNSGFTLTSEERPVDLVNTTFKMYYARIPNLKANTKYYIKVRSASGSQRSRYTEPVTTRTDFSQSDYDDEEKDNQENANYYDQVKKFKNSLYWIMGTSSSTFKAKIRRDMAESYIKSSQDSFFVIELLEGEAKNRSMSAIYIPTAVMQLLSDRNSSLVIKVPGAEYNIRPNAIDYTNAEEIEEVRDDSDVKEVYLYIEIEKLSKSSNSGPSGTTAVSDIHKMKVQAVGMERTDADIEQTIKDKIDEYIANGLTSLKGISSSSKDTPQELKDEIEEIVEEVEDNYREFIEDYIEGGGSYSSIIEDTEDFDAFKVPLNVKMSADPAVKGAKSGYTYSGSSWIKVPSTVSYSGAAVSFDFSKPGRLAVFYVDVASQYNIPITHWAKNDMTSFASKYDISDVFNQYTNIDSNLSVNNTILIVEKVINGAKIEGNMSLQDKAKKIGIDGLISYAAPGRNVTRQELAALTVRIYELKTGVKASDLKLKKTIIIRDAAEIKNSYYKPAEICVDMSFITLDSNKNFKPKDACSGAQVVTVLTRLLKVLGEL